MRPPKALLAAALTALAAGTAQGQSSPAEACATLDASLRSPCLISAQAATSAQAWMSALVAGANPTPGAAAATGLHLGALRRVSASVTGSLVHGSLPDLASASVSPTDEARFGEAGATAPAISARAVVEIGRGATLAPTLGGIGAVELLGSAGWAAQPGPGGGFGGGGSAISYGGGVRVGLLRESFGVPGVAASVLYHRLGRVGAGAVCPTGIGIVPAGSSAQRVRVEQGDCVAGDPGDLASYSMDLATWSARGVVAKHLGAVGLAAGAGYDRSRSTVDLAARAAPGEVVTPAESYVRIRGARLRQGRWSAFVDGSYSLLVTTLSAEAGWIAGADPVPGFPSASSDFDPRQGSFYGSVGVRVAL